MFYVCIWCSRPWRLSVSSVHDFLCCGGPAVYFLFCFVVLFFMGVVPLHTPVSALACDCPPTLICCTCSSLICPSFCRSLCVLVSLLHLFLMCLVPASTLSFEFAICLMWTSSSCFCYRLWHYCILWRRRDLNSYETGLLLLRKRGQKGVIKSLQQVLVLSNSALDLCSFPSMIWGVSFLALTLAQTLCILQTKQFLFCWRQHHDRTRKYTGFNQQISSDPKAHGLHQNLHFDGK